MSGSAHGCLPGKAGTSMTKPTINPGRSHQELVDDRATISSRKDDHVRLAARIRSQEVEPYQLAVWDELDQCEFIHQALPEIAVDQVDISSTVAGIAQSSPFFINAMTGGTVGTNALNSQLAAVASRTGAAMALGSMSILVKKPEVQGFYRTLRKDNPNVNFIANLGAEHSVEAAQLVVETVDAQALQLHLNAAQEIVMPEGSRDFRGWTDHIGRIVDAMDKKGVPVIVKEVGFGLSRETVERLYSLGVRWVDLAGKGGTNFIHIENERRKEALRRPDCQGETQGELQLHGSAHADSLDFSYLSSWGISTFRSLLEARSVSERFGDLHIIASGGVRNPLDVVKYLASGADCVGLSGFFLKAIQEEGVEGTVALVDEWKEHIRLLMALLGVRDIQDLRSSASLVYPQSLVSYCRQRGIRL